jgi:hypothetical protein
VRVVGAAIHAVVRLGESGFDFRWPLACPLVSPVGRGSRLAIPTIVSSFLITTSRSTPWPGACVQVPHHSLIHLFIKEKHAYPIK